MIKIGIISPPFYSHFKPLLSLGCILKTKFDDIIIACSSAFEKFSDIIMLSSSNTT
jgi:hypothetical protein